MTHSDTCRKIVYYINQRHEEILKIYKKDKVPRGPGGPVPRQTAHQPRARRIVASSSQAFGACAPVRHVISRTLPGRQESQGAGQSSIETTSKCKAAEAASCSFDAKALHSLHIFTLFSIFAGSCWSLLRGLNVMM